MAALESPVHRSLDTAIEPTVHRPIVAAIDVPIVLSHRAAVYSPKWPAQSTALVAAIDAAVQ